MNQAIAMPTGKAGELFIPALGRTIQQVEWREDDVYDHAQQTVLAVTAGSKLKFFKDLTSKNLQHVNITTQSKIPSQSEMVAFRIGVHIAQAFGEAEPSFRPLPAAEALAPLKLPDAQALCAGDFLRLWPHLHGTDGFFAAVWQRA